MSGRRKPRKVPLKVLAPLHLGQRPDRPPSLIVEAEGKFAKIEIPGQVRGTRIGISRRGAEHLLDWLTAWLLPESKQTLWGIDGIVQECDVSRRTVYNWQRRPDFPREVPVVGGNGPVWEARAVKAWVRLARPQSRKDRG